MDKANNQPLLIRANAAAWLARLRSEKRTTEDEAAFREWLAADPRHAAAFEIMNVVWDAARPVRRDLRGKIPSVDRHINRRMVFGGIAVAAGVGGTLILTEAAQANVYRTEIGEQRHVLLRDGTELFLDTNTKVVVDLDKKNRKAVLEYGRANFRLAPSASRPFIVDVADNIIVGTYTTFDVLREGESVSVILLQGQATVESTQAGATPTRLLDGGERLMLTRKSAKIDKPNLLPLVAWHTGQAIFRDETLIQAANEMNRYSTLRLEIADARIQDLKVSGVYRVGDNAEFALALEKLLPVRTRQVDDRIEIISSEASAKI